MYQKIKQYLKSWLEQNTPKLLVLIRKYKLGIKYIISGSISAVILLGILYVLTDIFGMWYITSDIIAFSVALIVSFVLQKFWTFRDDDLGRMRKQFAIYASLGVVNFFLNPALLYIVVEYLHIWYILAQALVTALLAILNFMLNKFIIFKKERTYESTNDKHRQ